MQGEINTIISELQRCGDKPLEVAYLESAEILSQEDFMHELAVEERCNATISKAIKRLMLIKGMKQMIQTGNEKAPRRVILEQK
jgi:hypothetical protein